MYSRIYLTVVGSLYIALGLWCAVSPDVTSTKVGFQLLNDSGKSEFMTVYGGLEFGMAVVFLAALVNRESMAFGIWSCVIIHGALVLFRSISFVCYSDVSSFTYKLAIGEWVIFLWGLACLFAGQVRLNSR